MKKKNENKAAIGVGIAATVAAIAGAYYFYGSGEGSKRRKHLTSWMVSMKAEVMDKLEDAKEINNEAYEAIIGTVAQKYKKLKNIDPQEVIELASRMRGHWKDIQKDIKKTTKETTKPVTKTIKKAPTTKKRE